MLTARVPQSSFRYTQFRQNSDSPGQQDPHLVMLLWHDLGSAEPHVHKSLRRSHGELLFQRRDSLAV
jgi:hypothetical protein